MAKISKISINTSTPTAVVSSTYSQTVVVCEDPTVGGWPTGNLLIFHPTTVAPIAAGATGRSIVAGDSYNFAKGNGGGYIPSDIIGYVQAVTSPTTIVVDEAGS